MVLKGNNEFAWQLLCKTLNYREERGATNMLVQYI
jgi:hypothetical protein